MTKILLVIGDAAEMTDTLYPLYRMQEEGYECVVAAPEKRAYHLVTHERRPGWDITVESYGRMLPADIAFRDVAADEYAGMIISGGRAPEYIRYDQDLLAITREMAGSGKPIASICHGIEVLAAADVLKNIQVTTVAKCRYDAESGGAVYLERPVVVDRNIVSARTYDDNPLWMREYMSLLRAHCQTVGPQTGVDRT